MAEILGDLGGGTTKADVETASNQVFVMGAPGKTQIASKKPKKETKELYIL